MEDPARAFELAGVTLDSSTRDAFLLGQPLGLTRTEFRVLQFLLESDGRAFSREEIIAAVQGDDYPVTAHSLDNHILALRRKLGNHGHLIETVRGFGFRRRAN
jgi:two-component system, OmpR family, alkaline phosphatase synthesis response regulator PhoP